MADELLVKKIRERMAKKGASLDGLRREFSQVYLEQDIDGAIHEYEEEKERLELPVPEGRKMEGKRVQANVFFLFLHFVFNNPLLTFFALCYVFYRILLWSNESVHVVSDDKFAFFIIFHLLLFFGGIIVIAKLLSWIADSSQEFGPAQYQFLRGMQLQLLNLGAFLGLLKIIETQQGLVIVLFAITILTFMIILISMAYRILIMKAITFFIIFEAISLAIWGAIYILKGILFNSA
ncbi:MAG: hypothetical protein ABIJ21_05680 [Nanoarchaeota archaeon]